MRATTADLAITWSAAPEKWYPDLYISEIRADGGFGASMGPFPAEPIDTLEKRMIATWGAPLSVAIRIKEKGQARFFGTVYFLDVSERAAAVLPVPEKPMSELEMLRAEMREMRENHAKPQSVAHVPLDPFSASLQIFNLVDAAATKMIARVNPTPAAPNIAEIVELAKQAAEKTNDKIQLIEKAGPIVASFFDRMFGIVEKTIDARREEVLARAGMAQLEANERASNAKTPQIEEPPAPVLPGVLFGSQGGTTGEPAQVVETKEASTEGSENAAE